MKHSLRRSRSGTVLICVLACLIVVTALIGSTTQAALRARNAARVQKQLRQTELLLEAGVLRAAQQLKRSADYDGEEWHPQLFPASQAKSKAESDGEVHSGGQATVDIRVTEADDSSKRHIEVVARFDSHIAATGPLQRSHQFTISISPASSSEKQ